MKVKIKQLPNGEGLPLPSYAIEGSAGLDLAAASNGEIGPGEWQAFGTGYAVEIPFGFEAQIRPRSGIAKRLGVTVLNAPATIDHGYVGEIIVLLVNHSLESVTISRGDRIAQLVIAPVVTVDLELVGDLAATVRGDGGFGSTGGWAGVKPGLREFRGVRDEN